MKNHPDVWLDESEDLPGKNIYSCDICNKDFMYNRSLKLHMKNHERIKELITSDKDLRDGCTNDDSPSTSQLVEDNDPDIKDLQKLFKNFFLKKKSSEELINSKLIFSSQGGT